MKNPIITLITIGMLIILTGPALSQEMVTFSWYCNYYGDELVDDVYSFASDQDARNAIKRIVEHTGIEPNFIILAANVPNATATIVGEQRAIFYNQEFMLRIKDATNTDWAAISILAHEIGHHLQGHTIQSRGSRPEIELEADKYSGFVLQKMGATLDQALTAMNTFGSDQGSATHPPRSARLAAITNGWRNAASIYSNPPDTDTPPEKTPVPQPPSVSPQHPQPSPVTSIPSTPQYVARCVFINDPVAYFVTSRDDIVGVLQNGQVILVGKRIAPIYPGFAWMYQTAYVTYGVGANGVIYSRTPNGMPFQVGYVTNP